MPKIYSAIIFKIKLTVIMARKETQTLKIVVTPYIGGQCWLKINLPLLFPAGTPHNLWRNPSGFHGALVEKGCSKEPELYRKCYLGNN